MTKNFELFLPDGSTYRKSEPPPLGEKFGDWSGQSSARTNYLELPGGGMLLFDLSRLTLQDFRQMRDHYQVGISLWILTFMMHQIDWHIECEDKKIQEHVSENFSEMWTPIVRSMSQAFWAGYSPSVLQWDNDISGRRVVLDKVKDLLPEKCSVNWKDVDGYAPPGHAPPKIQLFDGIKQEGASWPVPAEASLWYPLLMENGNYYGRKLLRPAFPAWFFSQLIHLFSNRYFERFGEPLPIGRYPMAGSGDLKDAKGNAISPKKVMEDIVSGIRSRAVTVIPSDRNMDASSAAGRSYEWDIEYLESQMRGADFERYMTRLDEEISLALFTPVLLYRTADVGSYNLGDAHFRLFMSMLNALAADHKRYIDKYVLNRMVDLNFGPNAPRCKWIPRKLGKDTPETLRAALSGLITAGLVTIDLDELSVALGIGVHEREILTTDPVDPNADPANSPGGTTGDTPSDETGTGGSNKPSNRSGAGLGSTAGNRAAAKHALQGMADRARAQILKANALPPVLDLGHRRQLSDAVGSDQALHLMTAFDGWWSEFSSNCADTHKAVAAVNTVLVSMAE